MSETAGHRDQTIRLADGRTLGWTEYGDPDGRPLFYFHGWPSSRLEAVILDGFARGERVRVISVDRPGFGLSTYKRGYEILDWPEDVSTLAMALGVDRFPVLGMSSGAPYALACAYRLPDKVVAAGVVSGIGPLDDRLQGSALPKEEMRLFKLARWAPWLTRLVLRMFVRGLLRDPHGALVKMSKRMAAADQAIMRRPDTAAWFSAAVKEAVRQGTKGAVESIALEGKPWGFRLEEVKARVFLWHGEEDRFIPPAMGRRVAERLPNCQAAFCPGEGHVSTMANRGSEILRTLSSANS